MLKSLIILFVFLISGCASMASINEVTKTDKGVLFTMNTPGKMSYKGNDIEVEIDTRTSSLLRTLVEGVVVQGLKSDR